MQGLESLFRGTIQRRQEVHTEQVAAALHLYGCIALQRTCSYEWHRVVFGKAGSVSLRRLSEYTTSAVSKR